MTTIILVAFSFFFYQLLIKPILNPSTIPNNSSHYQRMDQNQNLMEMWRQLQDFQKEKKNQPTASKNSKVKSNGYQGGEYIDYEEV